MKISLVAIDLDGTLLDDKKQIAPANEAAVKKSLLQGVKIVLCSGRSPKAIQRYNRQLGNCGEDCYGIGFHGGVVFRTDTEQPLYEQRMDKDSLAALIKAVKSVCPEAPIMVYTAWDAVYAETRSPEALEYTGMVGIPLYIKDSFENVLTDGALKVIISWTPNKLQEIYAQLSAKTLPYRMFFSGASHLEFVHKDVNKYQGLSILGQRLGVLMEETGAVGDNANDIELVQGVAVGVAMQNGLDALKAVAKYTTASDNNNSGVQEALAYICKYYS